MIRKIISQRNSYTLTLPIKWVRDHGLDKNEEIELEEEREGLFIKALSVPKKEKDIRLDFTDENFIRYMLNNLYRNGYDTINFNFKNKIAEKIIEDNIHLFLGWQVTEKKENRLKIENLTEPTTEKFDILLRRMFFIEEGDLNLIREGNIKEILKDSKEIIKIDNFLRRCISKRIVDKEKIFFYWNISATLIWIHRDIRSISKYINKEEITKQKDVLDKLNNSFKLIHEGFFEKDLKKIESVVKICKNLQKDEKKLFKKSGIVAHYLLRLNRYILLLCSPCIGIIS